MSNCGTCDVYGPLLCKAHSVLQSHSNMQATDGASWRVYRCTNVLCPQVDAELRVTPEGRGPFLAWPDLTCQCGMAPEVVDWRTPYGAPSRTLV